MMGKGDFGLGACAFCGRVFQKSRRGQKFCPRKTSHCQTLAAVRAETDRRRAERKAEILGRPVVLDIEVAEAEALHGRHTLFSQFISGHLWREELVGRMPAHGSRSS